MNMEKPQSLIDLDVHNIPKSKFKILSNDCNINSLIKKQAKKLSISFDNIILWSSTSGIETLWYDTYFEKGTGKLILTFRYGKKLRVLYHEN